MWVSLRPQVRKWHLLGPTAITTTEAETDNIHRQPTNSETQTNDQ